MALTRNFKETVIVNATIGFEQLAALTAKPSMDNLAAIFRAVRERLNVSLSAHSVSA